MPAENIADKALSDTAQESAGDIIEDLLPESAGDHADNKEDALPESAGSHVDNKEDMLSESAGDHVDNKEDALQSAADNDAEAAPVKPAGKKKKNTPWKAARKKIRRSLSKGADRKNKNVPPKAAGEKSGDILQKAAGGKDGDVLLKNAGDNAGPSPEMELPSSELLENELKKEKYRNRFFTTMRSTVFGLITVAAMAVLVAILFLPVLHIYGQSMNGTLDNGDIVLSLKNSSMGTGEVIAFYYNNNILVKRVIANSGEWVDIDQDGNVYVNQKRIEEPYLHEPKAYGETDIELPYQVPEGKVFVMGDNREVSIDSRNTAVGCVDQEQVVGHIVFRVWPFSKIGFVN